LTAKPAAAFSDIVFITDILSHVSASIIILRIVWTCDCCFFADSSW